MHFTLARNWLLKFAILGAYSMFVLGSRGPLADAPASEAMKVVVKTPTRVIITLPKRVIIIGKKIRIVIPRIPIPAPPHVS